MKYVRHVNKRVWVKKEHSHTILHTGQGGRLATEVDWPHLPPSPPRLAGGREEKGALGATATTAAAKRCCYAMRGERRVGEGASE